MVRCLFLFGFLFLLGCPKQNTGTTTTTPPPETRLPPLPPEEIPPASWLDQAPKEAAPAVNDEVLEAGRKLYLKRCAKCHGDSGAGDGPYASETPILPRDFRQGIFKFRTTPSGSFPTDSDIFRTITRGVPGAKMPGTLELSEKERWSLVFYVQELTLAEEGDEKLTPITIPTPTTSDANSTKRGRGVYLLLRCWVCHGLEGDGVGAASVEMMDDWGNPISVPDLTKPWPYKNGSTSQDIYRTIVTGLDGSPMGSFATDPNWLVTKKGFSSNWQQLYAKNFNKKAIDDFQWFIDQLPNDLPRSITEKQKMSDAYLYDLINYIRATFPRKEK